MISVETWHALKAFSLAEIPAFNIVKKHCQSLKELRILWRIGYFSMWKWPSYIKLALAHSAFNKVFYIYCLFLTLISLGQACMEGQILVIFFIIGLSNFIGKTNSDDFNSSFFQSASFWLSSFLVYTYKISRLKPIHLYCGLIFV